MSVLYNMSGTVDNRQELLLHRLGNPVLVYNQAIFSQMIAHLSERKLMAVDTESDSLFSYVPQVCLIQISTCTDPQGDPSTVTDYLVDPLRFNRLSELASLLADPDHIVIMHAAENDMLLLQQEFGFSFNCIFDTQLAARILGWTHVGLAAILEDQFGVTTNKRMQRANWRKRPLPPQQIIYAQADTHFLPMLRELQIADLKKADRWDEAREAFRQLVQLDRRDRPAQDRTFWQMKETRDVPRAHTGVLEALWEWREQEAERRNVPPFKIVYNSTLVKLATLRPARLADLEEIPGLGNSNLQRYGRALLEIVTEGAKRPLPELPEPTLRPEQTLDKPALARFDALRNWRSKVATKRGVTPDIVLTNDILMEIAKRQPQDLAALQEIAGIGPWKARTYGPELLRIVAN